MRRGQLANVPQDAIDVHWMVLFKPPGIDHRWLWWLALLVRSTWLMRRLLRLKRWSKDWVLARTAAKQGRTYRVNVVAYLPKHPAAEALGRALQLTLEAEGVWVADVKTFDSWDDYLTAAIRSTALVETIVPADSGLVSDARARVVAYQGWGHKVGEGL